MDDEQQTESTETSSDKAKSVTVEQKPTTSREAELDAELNVSSEEFNPLRALNTPDFRVTHRKPKVIYQNLAALESALNKVGVWQLNKTQANTNVNKGKVVTEEQTERRFQPHQMAIARTEEQKAASLEKHTRNLFTYMSKITGPLQQLQKWRQSKQRIVVMVRNEHGVRGTTEGELKAFDKQWNIVLVNALETWTRRKYKFGVNNLAGLPAARDCSKQLRNLGIKLPKVEIKSLNRKNVQVKRHIPQLLIRGEQIVLIKPLQNKIM